MKVLITNKGSQQEEGHSRGLLCDCRTSNFAKIHLNDDDDMVAVLQMMMMMMVMVFWMGMRMMMVTVSRMMKIPMMTETASLMKMMNSKPSLYLYVLYLFVKSIYIFLSIHCNLECTRTTFNCIANCYGIL